MINKLFSFFRTGKNEPEPVKDEPTTVNAAPARTVILCANCGEIISGNDRYCRICGTDTRSSKPYDPEKDGPMQCIYGPPPVMREHKCTKCGYTWTTHLMIDNQGFCPECGGKAIMTMGEDPYTPKRL